MFNKPFWLVINELGIPGTDIWASAQYNGSYATDIMGGYAEGSFPLYLTPLETVALVRKIPGKHVQLFSPLGDIIYEGRIENVASQQKGLVVNSLGYYSHAGDLTSGLIYPATTPTSISEVIIDHIDLSTLWNKVYAFILPTTTDVTPLDFSGEGKIVDAIDKVLTYGSDDTVPKKMYFQILRDRIPHLITEPDLAESTYYLDLTRAKNSGSFADAAINIGTVFNKIQVLFDDSALGGQDFTNWYEDEKSQIAYGVREGTINLGQSVLAIANDVAAMAIDRYKNPEQTLSITVPDLLCTKNYDSLPGYAIRGGDVVLLSGETTDMFYQDYLPGQTSAIVTHTSYSIDSRSITINFGTRSPYFDMALALLGYGSTGIM